jgi:hypothetical protein
MGTHLYKVPAYRPFFFQIRNGTEYQVGKVIFYDRQTGHRINLNQGWFGDDSVKLVILKQELVKRAKEKLDGKAFFIRNTRLNDFFRDKSLYVNLYIPFEDMEFVRGDLAKRQGFVTKLIPIYTSKAHAGIEILDYDNLKTEHDEILKERAIEVVARLAVVERELDDLLEELKRLDPEDTIRKNLNEVKAKMNGSK